jgi:PAS domain S-box-containing protein
VYTGEKVYNKNQGYTLPHRKNGSNHLQKMASTSKKQITQSPASQRKSRKPNNVNLHAAQNNELTIAGIGASAGRLKALKDFFKELPDDTDMAEANRRLNQARDMFYALFHANPIPTAFTRLEDGVFINVNIEFLTYFGFQHEDIIGHSLQELNIGLEPQARMDLVTRIKNEGTVRNYEASILHPSGETRNILASIQYINLDNTDALITAFTDITDRVRAEQQVRALASELTAAEQTERHRLAQILHDDLQQRLFAVQMQMTFLKDAYEKNDLKVFEIDFPQVEGWLAEAIKVTRQLSVDISPPILHGEGLVEATIWLASQMEEQYGLAVDIKSRGTPRQLDENVRVLMFYAVRELLFNTVKHAGTLKATIDFEHGDERLRVRVSDQGKGFDDTEATSNSNITHGLLTIRYRLNLLGCTMNIKSQPGQGTEAIIEAPYGQVDR